MNPAPSIIQKITSYEYYKGAGGNKGEGAG